MLRVVGALLLTCCWVNPGFSNVTKTMSKGCKVQQIDYDDRGFGRVYVSACHGMKKGEYGEYTTKNSVIMTLVTQVMMADGALSISYDKATKVINHINAYNKDIRTYGTPQKSVKKRKKAFKGK